MVVVVFRSRVRAGLSPEILQELETRGARVAELAPSMPGFVSYKDFTSPDGESVTIVEFETHEQLAVWREHPEHRAVQELGRRAVFAEYQIQVCDLARTARFDGASVRRTTR
jgi:heme-degrading monooxygenase HmoA